MSTSDKQWRFLRCLSTLIWQVDQHDWSEGEVKLTMGRGYASAKANQADGGHPQSVHLYRMAMDLNLFVDDVYITGDHPVWHTLGDMWKALDPDARWGGDFSFKDYNHFSFEHNGVS